MKVEVEELAPCKKALIVEIPEEVVSDKLRAIYESIRREVKIPGFRPGKAPISIIRARFSEYVKAQALEELFKEYYPQALEEASLKPATDLSFEDIEFDEGKPFKFKAVFEVHPDFELKEYKGIKVKKKKYKITDEEVERSIDRLREQFAKFEDKDGPAEIGDVVIIDYEAFEGDVPVKGGKLEGVTIELGRGDTVKGFDEQIVGKKAGDEFEIEVDYPEDYFDKEVAGKKIKFKVKLVAVKKKIVPQLDDKFAKEFGAESLDDLKRKVKAELEKSFEERAKNEAANELLSRLADEYDFPVPESIVKEKLEQKIRDYELDLRVKGIEPTEEEMEKARKELRDQVIKEVKIAYIVNKIAEREGIDVSREEVEKRIEDVSRRYNISSERLIDFMKQTGRYTGFAADIMASKVVDFLLEHADVEEEEVLVGDTKGEDNAAGSDSN